MFPVVENSKRVAALWYYGPVTPVACVWSKFAATSHRRGGYCNCNSCIWWQTNTKTHQETR